MSEFETPKISIPYLSNKCKATWDDKGIYNSKKIYSLALKDQSFDPLFLLGIINSPLFTFFIRNVGAVLSRNATRFTLQYMNDFPIPECSQKIQKSLSKLVFERLEVQKEFDSYEIPTPSQIKKYEISVKLCEHKINDIVYEIYDLTDEEYQYIENLM